MPKIAHGVPRATTPPLASTSLTTPGSGGRDRAIDLLRGLCIVSMTTAHLAAGSWPWRVFHIGTFIDGAVGFVFLSGLVLGITQSGTIERAERCGPISSLASNLGPAVYLFSITNHVS